LLLTESASVRLALWSVISDLLVSGKVRPVVAKVFALEDAADGLRYLIEERPFGRVVLRI
jgi:NADPH2:quinone reductase